MKKKTFFKNYFLIFIYLIVLNVGCNTKSIQKEIKVNSQENSKTQNRLKDEKSPYLLQHANNPVDWYPWGEEAFKAAESQDKPIFLSIGYSTCHWCHVMAHESFEDEEIASLINKYFIAIKVDREERPDIDNIYMSAVQAMTGSGGWPLTVFLTFDKKPFFGGTYFPPHSKWGSPGLIDVIEKTQRAWRDNRQQLVESSTSLTEQLDRFQTKRDLTTGLTPNVFKKSFSSFSRSFDSVYAGFGSSPKFPTSHNLSFLLRYWHRTQNSEALDMVEKTLQAMAKGGMYDQLGGGFHRYSTDRMWQVPHFEKMLYDQAMLATTYVEAYQITKNEFYANIAREIFDYVLREMTDEKGGFYSAEDADSYDPDESEDVLHREKKEGAFYLWRYDEIVETLKISDAEIFNDYYGIKKDGNAQNDPHGEFTNKNILFVDKTLEDVAKKFQRSEEEVKRIITSSSKKLLMLRDKRDHSYLDDKVLTDWNGLMITSLSFGGRVLNESRYGEAAKKAADFVLQEMTAKKGRLLHRYRDGEVGIMGSLEDYAFFINGLLGVYEVNFEIKYLQKAHQLSEDMISLFWDQTQGGFYFTASDAEKLLYRQKEVYDGAIPSGNSIAGLVLLKLYRITFDEKFEKKAEELFNFFSQDIVSHPSAYSQFLIAYDFAVGPSKEIVLVASKEDSLLQEMLWEIYGTFNPNKVVLLKDESNQEELNKLAPFTKNQKVINGLPTVYVCENKNCKYPTNDVIKLREILK